MAKAMRKYFHENFDGAETANIQPSESFPVYGIVSHVVELQQIFNSPRYLLEF